MKVLMRKYKKNIVYIGIGSNLNGHMSTSFNMLNIVISYLSLKGLRVISSSSIYKSRPLPSGLGPYFYNSVIIVKSSMKAVDILRILKDIERIFGRKKYKYKNSPRVLDLDLLDCRGEISNMGSLLKLPHPKLTKRDFVLHPLYELNPNWAHPESAIKIKSLLVRNNRYSIGLAKLKKNGNC